MANTFSKSLHIWYEQAKNKYMQVLMDHLRSLTKVKDIDMTKFLAIKKL
jgi:hypothetical protein